MKLLAGRLVALALLLTAGNGSASEITIIQYDLSGVVNLAPPGPFTQQPVFPSSAAGPGGVGSKTTFRFVPRPAGQVDVQLLTFAQSNGLTYSPHLSGNLRLTLLSPGITGGRLVGQTAVGTGSAAGNRYGTVHCLTVPSLCSVFIGHTALSVQWPQTRLGTPVHFAGRTPSGASGSGWVFNTNFSTVRAVRPTRLGVYGYMRGTADLVGTEIGRTVLPVPEPHPWARLAASLLALMWARRLWPGSARTRHL